MAGDALGKAVGVPLVIPRFTSNHDTHGILASLILVLLIPYALSDYQGDALISLKKSLNATGYQLMDWNSDQVNPCTWTNVICDSNSGVTTSVTLSSMGLSGVISPHVGVLKNLLTLNLQGNAITGEIPEALGNLSSLTTLDLEYNKIAGEIPSSLGQLTKLQFLVLSHNSLNGSIPEALSSIQNLIDLQLSYNNLTGSIPESLFKIPKYNFSGNNLSCGRGFAHPCETLPSPGARRSIVPLIAGLAGGLVAILLLTRLLLLFAFVKGPKGGEVYVDVAGEVDRRIPFGQLRRFAWRELQLATNGFDESNVLGRGGFGKVYRGVLSDGTSVAVKRLADSESPGGDAAFRREVEMISVAVHRNLLRLIGFCATSSERLLVYPFMPNLSVAHRLRDLKPGDPVLSWECRRRVALGTARGLEYLHEHCNPRIIHRDVKAANVLLDESLEAVVGDFGLAQLVDVRRADVTTQVRGTMGHIAPEYLSTGKSSERTDVFGYGVMLLELVTGQRAVDFSRLDREDDVLLLDHVKKLEMDGRLDSIVDPNLRGRYAATEVQMITRVALLCTQPSPDDRPTMSEVVRMLEGEGLDQRWEEWKNVEVTRREEYLRLQRRLDWPRVAHDDSICNMDAIELSAGR